ncbi:pfs domain-containing protein [Colletotrichum plurivorum]|uniref:Pfs domain-containing protein n=1 Tax=Colletotrichum plurivorum TaxID=2175906 RepID=A0A8H6J8K7_9PEZI|nr:pfs domain-containing protein [Colletotrichum plurivorum]
MRLPISALASLVLGTTMALTAEKPTTASKFTSYSYGSNVLQSYDVYLPSETSSASPDKYWVIYIHGGFYRDLAQNATTVEAAIATLEANSSDVLQKQVAGIASLNYRLSALPGAQPDDTPPNELQKARWPDHLNDAVAAVKDLGERYPIDGKYIIGGHSVGAQMSFLAALETLKDDSIPKPAAVLGISGIYDYPQLHVTHPDYDVLVLNAMREDQLVEASPSKADAEKYAALGLEAFVIAHSRNDGLVPWDQVEAIEATLGTLPELKNKTTLVELDGQHNEIWRGGVQLAKAFTETLAVLQETPKNECQSTWSRVGLVGHIVNAFLSLLISVSVVDNLCQYCLMAFLDHKLYTVAWIAPLEIELRAALLMLDKRHRGHFPMGPGDEYYFHAGSMCGHNVVIATLPAGQEYGTASAAALASHVNKAFPNLWFGLLVGVAAGLPNFSSDPPRDIRLGDVLVALPVGDSAGLVGYDLGKALGEDGVQPLRFGQVLANTKAIVRSAIGSIKVEAPFDTKRFLPFYESIKAEQHANGDFTDPGQHVDKYYDVDGDGKEHEVVRPRRPDFKRTRVWYGPIGSGEKLMRNARQRNELRDRYNVIGLEMEAAGTMNHIPPDSKTWKPETRRTPWTLVVYGLAGVGKSQLCLKAVVDNQERFQGVFYVDASNNASAMRDFLEIARVCSNDRHWEDMKADEKVRLTRAWLACQKDPWVLIVDNADSQDVSLDPFIPTAGPGTIIVTTTDEQFATYSDETCKIEALNSEDAVDLLLSYKQPGVAMDTRQLEAAKLLATDLLGGHPLAITQAGSCIFSMHCSYTEYCQQFNKSPRRSLLLLYKPRWRRGASPREPVWKTFTLLLEQMKSSNDKGSVQAIELLRTLCFFHHEGIQEQLFNRPWEDKKYAPRKSHIPSILRGPRWDELGLRDAFEILCRYSLISYSDSAAHDRQYSMPRLVQTVCRESLSPDEQNKYALRAASMISSALSGIPMSWASTWIDNPAGFGLQKSLVPHIKACIKDRDRVRIICRGSDTQDQKIKTKMALLLARACSATGHFQDARILLKAVCRAYEVNKSAKPIHPDALEPMEQHAACEAQLGRHNAACELRHLILEQHKMSRPDDEVMCAAMMNLADSLWMTTKRKEALKMAQDALRHRTQNLKPGDPRLLRTKRKVADSCWKIPTLAKASSVKSGKGDIPEVDALNALASKSALADSYHWNGNLKAALALRREVYEKRREILGHEHLAAWRSGVRLARPL